MLETRWHTDQGWELVSEVFKPMLPPVVRTFVPPLVRRRVIATIVAQGTGRHTHEEIVAIGKADVTSASVLLGDKKFFLGDEPRTIDACTYSFLENVITAPFEGPLTEHARSLKNVVAYCSRMKERFYA